MRTSSSAYDRAGNPTSVTDYRGHTVTLTSDATGLITKAVQPVSETEPISTTFGYDAAGNRTRFTDGTELPAPAHPDCPGLRRSSSSGTLNGSAPWPRSRNGLRLA
ncbi:RHS repeat domain-containing protein [Streptomyces sp. NPDC050421]|uniref:RHS repeat domain-containing protein n=1 Tax=Streptomyces sp. NPDC050421 TaxID=3365613 RepID=UPI0037884566